MNEVTQKLNKMESFHKNRLAIGLTLTTLLLARYINASDIPAAAPKLPIYMGTVDGKSYFHDDTNYINWYGADAICKASGLQLATITTAAQFAFLNGLHESLQRGVYWLGAREARESRMFSWDLTGNDVSGTISNFTDNLGDTYFACLTYVGEDENRIQAYPCIETYPNVGTFCET